jgi:hypothetical protein
MKNGTFTILSPPIPNVKIAAPVLNNIFDADLPTRDKVDPADSSNTAKVSVRLSNVMVVS